MHFAWDTTFCTEKEYIHVITKITSTSKSALSGFSCYFWQALVFACLFFKTGEEGIACSWKCCILKIPYSLLKNKHTLPNGSDRIPLKRIICASRSAQGRSPLQPPAHSGANLQVAPGSPGPFWALTISWGEPSKSLSWPLSPPFLWIYFVSSQNFPCWNLRLLPRHFVVHLWEICLVYTSNGIRLVLSPATCLEMSC